MSTATPSDSNGAKTSDAPEARCRVIAAAALVILISFGALGVAQGLFVQLDGWRWCGDPLSRVAGAVQVPA